MKKLILMFALVLPLMSAAQVVKWVASEACMGTWDETTKTVVWDHANKVSIPVIFNGDKNTFTIMAKSILVLSTYNYEKTKESDEKTMWTIESITDDGVYVVITQIVFNDPYYATMLYLQYPDYVVKYTLTKL